MLGPGILVAATGVGAGDLATAAFTGNRLGTAVLWAVVVGAFLKFVLTEGLTRWQLATDSTLLEGCMTHLGRGFHWLFLAYFLLWSFLVGSALMSACGATLHAICPCLSAQADKILYGILHSIAAVALVKMGGYRLVEKVMTACVGVMFVAVIWIACALRPDPVEWIQGLLIPRIPQLNSGGLPWTIALLGGVGGTLTVLCYGYWIREEKREHVSDLATCRIDLAAGYVTTALFGISMLVIGSRMPAIEGGGARLLVELAASLENNLGRWGVLAKWVFLWAQSSRVQQLARGLAIAALPVRRTIAGCDDVKRERHRSRSRSRRFRTKPICTRYRRCRSQGSPGYLSRRHKKRMRSWARMVIPCLSAALLYLNNQSRWVGSAHRNRWTTNLVLTLTLATFLVVGILEIRARF